MDYNSQNCQDQEFVEYLRRTQKPPEWAMYFSMLEDAVRSFLGDIDPSEFLKKFDCNNGDYIDAMFWIFDMNNDDGDTRPRFEEVWDVLFPDLHVSAIQTKKELQKRIFERIHSYCDHSEIKSLTNVFVQKFGEILQALNSTISNVRERHEKKNESVNIPIREQEQGDKNEAPGTDGRRGAESGGADTSSGDHGVAKRTTWIGCLFDGLNDRGDDQPACDGANGGFRAEPAAATTGGVRIKKKKISITG